MVRYRYIELNTKMKKFTFKLHLNFLVGYPVQNLIQENIWLRSMVGQIQPIPLPPPPPPPPIQQFAEQQPLNLSQNHQQLQGISSQDSNYTVSGRGRRVNSGMARRNWRGRGSASGVVHGHRCQQCQQCQLFCQRCWFCQENSSNTR